MIESLLSYNSEPTGFDNSTATVPATPAKEFCFPGSASRPDTREEPSQSCSGNGTPAAGTMAAGVIGVENLTVLRPGCTTLHLFTFGPPDNGGATTGTTLISPAPAAANLPTAYGLTSRST